MNRGGWACVSASLFHQFFVLLIFFLNLAEEHADRFELIYLFFFLFALDIHVLFVAVLYSIGYTLSWFLVFFGKKLLRI